MSMIPANQDTAGCAARSPFMALVETWLANLPSDPAVLARRRAALRQELDAFAWQLLGRLEAVDAAEAGAVTEIPLDRDALSR